MKLNPDCVRDILLDVEGNTSFGKYFEYNPDSVASDLRISKYGSDVVMYHIKQCEYSGYFTEVHWYMNPSCLIIDLSPSAHKFLADIREETNWNKTKEIAKAAGSNSLDALKQIAAGVISTIIKAQLGL